MEKIKVIVFQDYTEIALEGWRELKLFTIASLSAIGRFVIWNFISLQAYPIYIIRQIHQK